MSECNILGMINVTVLRPSTSKKKFICCNSCDMEYSKREYKTLFDSKKLVYFKLNESTPSLTFCHDCLFKIAAGIAKKKNVEEISIKVSDGEKTFYFKISQDRKDD